MPLGEVSSFSSILSSNSGADHTCAWGGFWGDQLPIPTRYKISAKSRGLYTCNVKVLAWGDQSPPPRPRMVPTADANRLNMENDSIWDF